VGHEIDFTISDFVADLRAATPSAAAELLTEDVFAAARWVRTVPDRIRERLRQRFAREQSRFRQVTARLERAHPRRVVYDKSQLLDDLRLTLERGAVRHVQAKWSLWQMLKARLDRVCPKTALVRRRTATEERRARLSELARRQLAGHRAKLVALEDRLRLLAPQQVLARGYSITTDALTGQILRDASQLRPGQTLRTQLACGQVESLVRSAQSPQ
jgi:exodeoxyribonuclease VII large subunit